MHHFTVDVALWTEKLNLLYKQCFYWNNVQCQKLQQVFEVQSFGLDTGQQSFLPFVCCPVNDTLFKLSSDLHCFGCVQVFFETECTNQTQKKTRQCPLISCLVMRHNDQLAQRCHTALHYSAEKPTISWLWIQRSTTMPPQSSTFTRTVQILLTLNLSSFLSRVSTLMRDIDIRILSVCLSVRNVPVLDENGLTYCHSFFTVQYNPIILVLSASNIFTKFRRGHPLSGCKIQVGYEKFLNFLPISRYIAQTIQDSAIVTMEDE